jgi:predicted regulator of Ras-like GTPase activity (Roadblock/LC7/MglB family)
VRQTGPPTQSPPGDGWAGGRDDGEHGEHGDQTPAPPALESIVDDQPWRDPEQLREMMRAYQRGTERGRSSAAGTDEQPDSEEWSMTQHSSPTRDLAWLLDDLVDRVAHAERGIVLSNDGLLIASSKDIPRDDAEHLAAAAAGMQSLARGTGRFLGGGSARQTVIELESAFFFVMVAGEGACLAVQSSADADVGLIAYEMARLVASVGKFLSAPVRTGPGPY